MRRAHHDLRTTRLPPLRRGRERKVADLAGGQRRASIEVVNIEHDDELHKEMLELIPVIELNGERISKLIEYRGERFETAVREGLIDLVTKVPRGQPMPPSPPQTKELPPAPAAPADSTASASRSASPRDSRATSRCSRRPRRWRRTRSARRSWRASRT